MNPLLVDVTQFSRQPARSGIQRVLVEMARAWPPHSSTQFVARVDGRLVSLDAPEFANVAGEWFASSAVAPEHVAGAFRLGRRVAPAVADAATWLLPEPTYDREVLDDLRRRADGGQRVGAVAHDCFPQTHPGAFAGNGQAHTSAYFRLLGALPLVIATSTSTATALISRLRREPGRTPVAWLGTDHLPPGTRSAAPLVPEFLAVGTVEPRKRLDVVVAAWRLLRERAPETRLVLIGPPGWAEPAFLRELQELSAAPGGFDWRQDADDDEVASEMSVATAAVAIGDEGFGLTVVEAASRGCPVVFDGVQPAAELLEGHGAWRVDAGTPEALADALEQWCDVKHARARRQLVDTSGLPTWTLFAATVHERVMSS